MKKIIITGLLMVLGLAFFASGARAADAYNTDPGDLPTVMVTNITQNGGCGTGPGAGCWSTSTNANPGDIIGVQIYFHNSTQYLAEDTHVSIKPQSIPTTTNATFTGGVASSTIDRATGSATVSLSSAQSLTFIPGTVRIYKNQDQVGYSASDENSLFNSGLLIGDVSPGWNTQGGVVAQFQVSNNTIVTPPQQQSCYVNNFIANPSSIVRGGTSTLSWSTTGANTVSIVSDSNYSSSYEPSNGTLSISPYQTTRYTLTANCVDGTIRTANTIVTVGTPVVVGPVNTGTAPQAITTTATVLSTTQARLNGIAIPNTNAPTQSWFEWGPFDNLGYRTTPQNVVANTSTYYNDVVQGLQPGTIYFYRAVVQNQYGTSYGDTVRFQTIGAVQNTTTTVVKYTQKPATTTIIAKSAASLLELRVDSQFDHMCLGGNIVYNVTWHNISSQVLQNTIVRITLPKEIDYMVGSQGSYSVVDRTLTIPLGDVPPGAQGTIQVQGVITNDAVLGNLAVTTATVVYTNTRTHAQEDAIAYSLVTVSNQCPNILPAASVFGLSFLPHTLLEWLLLILVILALIVLVRQLSKKPTPPPAA